MNDGVVFDVKAFTGQDRVVGNKDPVFEFGGCRFIGSISNTCIDDDVVEDAIASQSVIFNSTPFPVGDVIVVAISAGTSTQHDS